MKSIMVTGGCGMIGSNLVKRLVKEGWDVYVADNLWRGKVGNLYDDDGQPVIDIGTHSPPFRPLTEEEDEKICNEINELKPDFCWVGIGAPKQEMWMWEHQEKIHGTRMLGVGAGFNFFAGTLDKAPAWVENAGLEWLFRLTKEPKRLWKRYILGGFTYLKLSIGHPAKRV